MPMHSRSRRSSTRLPKRFREGRTGILRLLMLTAICINFMLPSAIAQTYDIVIRGGLVVDPESGLEAIRNVGISESRIEAVSQEDLDGQRIIEAQGLVVAPGFIDLHAHGQDIENSRYQVLDGVTSALEMEIGMADVDDYYDLRAGKSLNNYGATIGHVPVRMELFDDPAQSLVPSGPGAHQPATPSEIATMRHQIERGLERGAIGVGFGLQYTPAASREEVHAMFEAAAEHKAACFVHIRHFGPNPPTSGINAIEEVLAASTITGAGLHVVHINSSGGRAAPLMLRMLADVKSRGFDVSTECYPYQAGMTAIESALFDGNWKGAFGIDYGDLQWVATGERLTAETYEKYRKTGGSVIIFMNPQEIVDEVVLHPMTMIASDGFIRDGKGHPRTAGTFTRVLRRYVRQDETLSLSDAIRKMALAPAQRLESRVPGMKDKGRVRVGADADLVVFDPETVSDRSTYEQPAQYATGMQHVFVGGVAVVSDGKLVEETLPGQPIRAPFQ